MGAGGSGGLFSGTKGSAPKIHKGKQDKHIEGTNNYKQELASGKHKSILTANPNKLLRDYAGKGIKVKNKEWVDFGKIIGKYYNNETGTYENTTKALIHYDNRGGAHIVPSDPNSNRANN